MSVKIIMTIEGEEDPKQRTVSQQLCLLYHGIGTLIEVLKMAGPSITKANASEEACKLYDAESRALMAIIERMNAFAEVKLKEEAEDRRQETGGEGDDGDQTITATA